MGERHVKVTLSAQIAGYKQGMEEAAKSTREVGSEADKLAQKREAFNLVGAAMVAVGAAAAVGFGAAVAKAAEFDQAMSYVGAATHESASNMDLLRDAALEAGARTVFSATESANAIEELGKAGLSTGDILGGGLSGALDLAAAGGLGVADAAGIAATALKTFKLEGSDMGHVADLLAAGAGKAMGDVSDLSAALAQSGMVASSTGLSIEETTATLAAFASQGLLGSDAGTSLKSMLQALTPTSAKAKETMDELGISAYDAQGNFIGMEKFAGVLRDGLSGLSVEQQQAALKTIFGSDAIRAATVLYTEGAEGIAEWTAAVDDQGYAAETAAMRLDNLAGDVEAFGGAMDTALIQSGATANDAFRMLVQGATGAVDAYNELPAPIQGAALALTGVVALAGTAGGAFLLAVPKIAEFKAAFDTLGTTAQRTGRIIGGVTRVAGGLAVIGTVIFAVDALSKSLAENFGPSAEETANSLRTATTAVGQFRAAIKDRFAKDMGAEEAAKQLAGLSAALDDAAAHSANWFDGIDTYNQEILNTFGVIGKDLATLAGSDLPAAQAQFRELADSAGLSEEAMAQLIDESPELKAALTEHATAAGKAADSQTLVNLATGDAPAVQETAAQAYLSTADAASAASDELLTLVQSFNEANGVGQDAVTANIAYQDSLAGVDEYIANARAGLEGYSLTLDQSTQAGRDNMGSLVDLASGYQSAAEKQLALDGSTKGYVANLQSGRDAVLQRARDLGATDAQVQFLSQHIVSMPTDKEVKITASTAAAQAEINSFVQQKRVATIMLRAVREDTNGDASGNGGMGTFAYGGHTGPGGKFDLAGVVHADEFVSTKETISHPTNRAVLEYMHAGGVMPDVSAMARADSGPTRVPAAWSPPTYSAPLVVASSSGDGSRSVQLSVQITAAPGMDEQQLIRRAEKQIVEKVRRELR